MPRWLLWLTLCCLAGLSLAQEPAPKGENQLLNSERIWQQFGSYGVDVLAQEDDFRQTSLYSGDTDNKITRTLATVQFIQPLDPRIARLHWQILTGDSIGSTFKSAGWQVRKNGLLIDEFPLINTRSEVADLMQLETGGRLALHVYLFSVARDDGEAINYALIAELHHPDYLQLDDLKNLYDAREIEARGTLFDTFDTLMARLENSIN